MKQRLVAMILSGLFCSGSLFAQISSPVQSGTTESLPYRLRKQQWNEIVSERGLHSSAFRKPDGTYVSYFSKELVNYYSPEGKLIPVNIELKQEKEGWSVSEQPLPAFVNTKGELSFRYNEKQIVFSSVVKINGQSLSSGSANVHGDTAIFHNVMNGVDKFILFRQGAVKYNYIFKNASAVPQGDLIIEEEYTADEPFVISAAEELSEQRAKGVAGHLQMINSAGKEILHLNTVFCYDAANNWTVGEYRFVQRGNRVQLQLIVNDQWMHDPARQFPITIDPLVVGPTTTYPNFYMPSCFAPNYNVDSILITVPAAITVNNLSVTSSYYADPFTTTVMGDGSMYFSTSCNQSTIFTVQPPTGNTPGTAYLEDFNMKSPLMCCYPQTCNQYTFYLRMHLSRSSNGSSCNTTYLYYTPSTLWPFSAYIEGNTVESYTSQVYLNPATLCANTCQTTATIYARYGVPPFTFSHPWSGTTSTAGVPVGCSPVNEIEHLTLDLPNCPNYCDPATSLAVPSPTVTDACGNSVSGWPSLSLTIKPVAQVTATPDSLAICNGTDVNLALNACLPGATINWFGNGISGTGNITDSLLSNTDTILHTSNYSAFVTMNGCTSDTILIPVTVEPNLNINFTSDPDPVFITQNTTFHPQIQTPGTLLGYYWNLGDGTTESLSDPQHIYTTPGEYLICLGTATSNACVDTLCRLINVLPLTIVPPNVISPNGDGINDALVFPYLEFYNGNTLVIMNRWGQTLYEKNNYQNDWTGDGHPDGVYYFVLHAGDQDYSGYFHIMRNK